MLIAPVTTGESGSPESAIGSDARGADNGSDTSNNSDDDTDSWDDFVDSIGESTGGVCIENDDDVEVLHGRVLQRLMDETDENYSHEAIPVPRYPDPLRHLDTHVQQTFHSLLDQFRQGQHAVPEFFNLTPDEWPEGQYPPYEFIPVGRGAQRRRIELPHAIWRPRAELWAKALHTLDFFLDRYGQPPSPDEESS